MSMGIHSTASSLLRRGVATTNSRLAKALLMGMGGEAEGEIITRTRIKGVLMAVMVVVVIRIETGMGMMGGSKEIGTVRKNDRMGVRRRDRTVD